MLRPLGLLAGVFVISCASTQSNAPVHNPDADKQYSEAVAARGELQSKWKGATAEDRQFCEARAGDCRMQVSDKRDEMLSAHRVPVCRERPNTDSEASCVIETLVKAGNTEPATEYLKSDIWCLEKLTQCLAKHQKDVAEDARLALIRQRRNAIESSAQGIAWRSRVTSASEKIKYIRATLPPDADSVCQQASENTACEGSIKGATEELDAELAKPEGQFDSKQANRVYENLTKTEASCYEPELKCLTKSLVKYGETAETRRWLQKNFDLLDKRQRLIEKKGDNESTPCLESGQASHQADIIQSYKAYVREPVLYFRTQLHRSFFAMHKSQIDCLSAGSDKG
jgi:hypothetical protein